MNIFDNFVLYSSFMKWGIHAYTQESDFIWAEEYTNQSHYLLVQAYTQESDYIWEE